MDDWGYVLVFFVLFSYCLSSSGSGSVQCHVCVFFFSASYCSLDSACLSCCFFLAYCLTLLVSLAFRSFAFHRCFLSGRFFVTLVASCLLVTLFVCSFHCSSGCFDFLTSNQLCLFLFWLSFHFCWLLLLVVVLCTMFVCLLVVAVVVLHCFISLSCSGSFSFSLFLCFLLFLRYALGGIFFWQK